MKQTILITLPLKDRHIDKIRTAFPGFDIHYFPSDHSVKNQHRECTIYLGIPTKEELSTCENLRFIQAGYAGVDTLPFEAFKQPALVLSSAKGIHNTQMSELFYAMVLYCARNMASWTNQKRRREWNKQPVKDSFFLAGKTLCIVGYGTIGKKIAMIALTFDMRVIGVRTSVNPEDRTSDPFTDEVIPVDELTGILPESDIVLNLLPLTDSTENFFDSDRFIEMKHGALFVNLGRGPTVVDDALINALNNGNLSFAALDVFRDEPLPDSHPFWNHPKIIMTPHIGGLMPDYWGAVVDIFIENTKRFIGGKDLLNPVDKEKGY